MGQSSSSTLPTVDPKLPYFSLTFRSPDKIVLSLADDDVIALTRSAIIESNPNEDNTDEFIHCEGRNETNLYVFKLRGLPFMRGCGRQSSFHATRMCCRILEKYNEHGWKLSLSSDLSRAKELTTWFFHRNPSIENKSGSERNLGENEDRHPGHDDNNKKDESMDKNLSKTNKTQNVVLCVSTSASDLIRLTNATSNACHQLAQAVRTAYNSNGIQYERVYGEKEYEIQLTGTPWMAQDTQTCIRTRKLLLEIIRRFERIGYRFYGTANMKGTSDCLFFISNGTEPAPDSPCSMTGNGNVFFANGNNGCRSTNSYFAISLNDGNCLRLIDGPSYIVKNILRAIVAYWPPKLKNLVALQEDGTCYEFKLRGNPWLGATSDEATGARVFLCGLFETMRSIGWEPVAALDVTRRVNDKAVIIFRSNKESTDIGEEHPSVDLQNVSRYWCLSMQNQSTIRLLGAPEKLRDGLRHTIGQMWPWGVQGEASLRDFKDSYEFKLGSGSWVSEGQNTAALMCCILKTLNDQGCRVVVSADVTGRFVSNNHGGAHSLDVHSWFITTGVVNEETKANCNGIKEKPPTRRASLPVLKRSATFADEFLVSIQPAVINGSNRPMDKECEQRKGIRKTSKAKLLRKLSTLTEYTRSPRVVSDLQVNNE